MLGTSLARSQHLATLVTSRNFDLLASYLSNNPQTPLDPNVLKQALSSNDVALLLTFYFHSSEVQKIVQDVSQKNINTPLVKKIAAYQAQFHDYRFSESISWKTVLDPHLDKWDDWTGDTPLHTAIRQHKCSTVTGLIDAGANLYAKNARGLTPIHFAAIQDSTDLLAYMSKRAKENEKVTRSWIYKLIVGTGLDVSIQDNEGESPIHVAAQNSNPDVLKWLFKHAKIIPLDKDRPDSRGLTPLHKAVIANIPENVKTLISQGANKDARANHKALSSLINDLGQYHGPLTPLWLALEKQHFEVIPHLVSSKNELHRTTNRAGMTAVHLAALQGKTLELSEWRDKYGLTSGGFVLRDKSGRTPLHYAALGDKLEAFEFLLHDHRFIVQDFEGNQSLHYACSQSQSTVAKFIVQQYQREQAYLASTNTIARKVRELEGTIDINAKNHKGATAYIIAVVCKNSAAIKILEDGHCDKTTLNDLLIKAITQPSHRNGPPSEQEAQVAMLSASLTELKSSSEENKDNLIHVCANHLNYRMALILLHPHPLAERRKVCTRLNDNNKTPLMVLDEAFSLTPENIKPMLKDSYEKFRRLLLRYDLAAYQREVNTTQNILKYHYQITQDKRSELMASDGYSYGANAVLYGMPALAFTSSWMGTGFLFCGIEAAFCAHFGIDIYDRAERVLQHLRPYAGQAMQRPITWAQNFLWGMGWYRNTTMRLAVEGVRQGSAFALTKIDPAEYNLAHKNYFTHTNLTGALYYAAEEMGGRRVVGPYLQEYIPTIESFFNTHLGVPTVDELTSMAGEALNDKIEEVTGINLKETLSEAYSYFRKEIAGVKPSKNELHEYFEEQIASQIKAQLKETDPDTVALLMQMAEIIFTKNYDSDLDTLNDLLSDWLYIANSGFHGEINYELLDSIVTGLVTDDKNYGDIVAQILLQPHLTSPYGFNAELVQTIVSEFVQKINLLYQETEQVGLTELSLAVQQTKNAFESHYLQTRKPGQEAYNDYQNTLANSFGKKNYTKFISADGCADYISWLIIKNNPLIFANMTYEQLASYAQMFKNLLLGLQGNAAKNLEKNMVNWFNDLNTFFGCMVLNQSFSSNTSLDFNSLTILNQYNPVQARAAFAVHQIQSFLEKSSDYTALSLDEQLNLYFSIIDAHFMRNASQTEKTIHSLTWNAFHSHAADKGNLQLITGQYTLDEAANHIFVTSKNAAELRWAGASEAETRVVPVQKFSTTKQVINFIKDNSSGNIGIGTSTNGTVGGTNIGSYNFSTGTLYPLNLSIGLPPVATLTFKMPSQIPTTATSVSTQAINSVIFAMTNISVPVSPLSAMWQESVEKAVAEHVHLPTEQDYLSTFTDTLHRYEQESANAMCDGVFECVVKVGVDAVVSLQSVASSTTQLLTNSTPLNLLAQIGLANGVIATREAYEPKPPSPFNPCRPGYANPIPFMTYSAATALLSGVGAAVIAHQNEDGANVFPIHQDEDAGYYPGGYGDPSLAGSTTLITPADKTDEPTTYITPVDQPGKQPNSTVFPIHNIPGMLIYNFAYKNLSSGSSNVQSSSDRIYDDSYQKHKPAPNGGALWKGASVNPIPDASTGQWLLEKAYSDEDNSSVLFNYYNGAIIKFRTSGDGKWHAYQIDKNVAEEVGSQILNDFYKDNLITKAEYKKLLKK